MASKRRNHDGRKQSKALARSKTTENRGLDPWELVWGQPYIDCDTLAAAIEDDLQRTPDPDFRTRLLVRDATRAMKSYWGPRRFTRWLKESPVHDAIRTILADKLGKEGFHNIRGRLVSNVGSNEIRQIFSILGQGVHDRVDVYIAGSIPTMIQGLTARPTDDIDIVNEVPAQIRKQTETLKRIRAEYGLTLGHVQSHYLPANWQQRRRFLGDFGGLHVYLVDVVDIFVSKLSSKQEKHKQDLRVLAVNLNKNDIKRRLLGDGKPFLDNSYLRPQIEENWRFVFQEPFGSEASEEAPPSQSDETKKKNGKKKLK
jgi:hypothetical protein